MKKFSFKPKRNGNPNPDFRPPASVAQDEKSWDDYIAHLNTLLNKKDERISYLLKQRYWKDRVIRQLKTENEKLKDIIRNNTNFCEACKGYDEKSPNYGYTEYCEGCFLVSVG